VISPMIVDRLVHVASPGLAQALWEGAVYDDQSGQLVTAAWMDYAHSQADMLPCTRPIDRDSDTGESLRHQGGGETAPLLHPG